MGVVPRDDARCPVCGSLERHRLCWLFLTGRTDLFDGRPRRMLHVAPEPVLTRRFQRVHGIDYVSVDLCSRLADVHMDLAQLAFADETFHVIYCSHVLEHIQDDVQAMRELRRVLRPDGWAILQVPILREVTFEDPRITDPDERLAMFGQHDHVRIYGQDFADRLREAGFQVRIDRLDEQADPVRRTLYGLDPTDSIFFCVTGV